MDDDEVKEAEANYFARCILMPRTLVEQEIRKMGGAVDFVDDNGNIRKLAVQFQVSVPMMAYRLAEIQTVEK